MVSVILVANTDSVWEHYRLSLRPIHTSEANTYCLRPIQAVWGQYRLSLRPIQTQSEANTDLFWGQYRLSPKPIQVVQGQYRLIMRVCGQYRLTLSPIQTQFEVTTDSVWLSPIQRVQNNTRVLGEVLAQFLGLSQPTWERPVSDQKLEMRSWG